MDDDSLPPWPDWTGFTSDMTIPEGYPYPFVKIDNANRLITLPKPLLYKILSELNPEHLAKLCRSDKRLSQICRAEEFWSFKHRQRFAKPQDFRKIFYDRQVEELQMVANNLKNEQQYKIKTLILSAGRQENEIDALRLAGFAQSRAAFSSYENFERDMLNKIRNPGLARRIPHPQPGIIPIIPILPPSIGPNFESQINPNAPIFQKYPPSQFGSPLLALIRAIYDLIAEYNPIFVRIFEETKKLSDKLDYYGAEDE